jgi:hypothetical protein
MKTTYALARYATIGYITPEYYKFPGDLAPSQGLKFADVPNGLAAFSKAPWVGKSREANREAWTDRSELPIYQFVQCGVAGVPT